MGARRSPARTPQKARRYGRSRPLSHQQARWCGNCPKARPCGRSTVETEAYVIGDASPGTPTWGNDAAQSLAVSRARTCVRLSRLRRLIHAQCVERSVPESAPACSFGRSSRLRRRGDHACKIEVYEALARPRPRPGQVLAQALRIDRSLDGLDLREQGPLWLAGARCDHEASEIGERRNRRERQNPAFLRDARPRKLRFYLAGESVRERREVAQWVRGQRGFLGRQWLTAPQVSFRKNEQCLVETVQNFVL